MNLKYFLFLLLFSNFTLLNSQYPYEQYDSYPYEEELFSCQCYCSDLCGPRNNKETDHPFIDKKLGICFCAIRDRKNFFRNGCHLKPKPNFERNCCLISHR